MRHGFKKTKFGQGQDADRALMRKLTINFLLHGKLKTTFSKVKALRPAVERVVGKIKRGNQADKNNLLTKLGNTKQLEPRFKDIVSSLSALKSGYTKIVKLGTRASDGAEMGELTWSRPVIATEQVKKVAPAKKGTKEKAEIKTKKS